MRPCPFSTVSTRATAGAGAHSAEGGIRPEGQGDVGFQRRLVALDREEVIAAALDDEATEVGLGEDRIAADDRTLDGKRLEQGQGRRDLVGLRRHPQLPDDTGSGRWTRIEDSWVVEQRVGWCAMRRGGEPWRGLLII